MKFITSVFKRKNLERFSLKYNKKDSEWEVKKANDLIYAGSQRQCEQFMHLNYDAFI